MAIHRIGLVADLFPAGVAEGAAAYGRANGLEIDPRWSMGGDWKSESPDWNAAIIETGATSAWEEFIPSLSVPLILLTPVAREIPFPLVSPDYRSCGAIAYNELSSLGVRNLVILSDSEEIMNHESTSGMKDAALAEGRKVIELDPAGKTTRSPIADRIRLYADLLQEIELPAGIFHPHPDVLYALSIELRARGLRIPEDIAMVAIQTGVQGTASMAPVPLTTVDPDGWQQGYFAVQLLHRHLSGETLVPTHHRIPPLGITRRDSTGLPVIRDPAVAKVLHLIQTRFASGLKIDELAKYAGVGRRNLEERFRKETHLTLHDCLMKRRIDEAKRLLRETPMSVSLVASTCGYSSVHYFSSAFKRTTGTNPATFRAANGATRSL